MSSSSHVSFSAAFAAIWTPKRIVFAGDEKNIVHAEHAYVALSGLTACAETAFDAAVEIQRILDACENPEEALAQVSEEIEEPLCQAAQYLHDNKPDDFKKHLSGKNALTVLFFYKRGDSVILSHMAFKTKKRGKAIVLELQQKNYPDRTTDIHSIKLLTGGMDAATEKSFLDGTSGQQALVYPQEALKTIMKRAIAEGQAQYPIHILEMNPTGIAESIVND